LRERIRAAQVLSTSNPTAVLLNAPTGSGKTLIATALIGEMSVGSEEDATEGDPALVFLWLTDQPELNKQTYDKMLATSGTLGTADLVIIDSALDVERLAPGKVYFLNTQKLGTGTSFVRQGDKRTFTLWDTLGQTIANAPSKFILIIDEAHRGAKGRDVAEADTIMQKFMKGNGLIAAVPLVIGISATPDRFVKLCNDTNRPVLRVDVDPQAVRESGLLKEFVDLYHPDEVQPNDVTMLLQAIGAFKKYQREWEAYAHSQSEEVPSPVLLIQVADAKSGSSGYSTTDLGTIVGVLTKELSSVASDPRWLAHAFQDGLDITIAGNPVRHIAPSAIDADAHVRVVLFKTSLNTGWDCPRAETMVSFRSAKDETNIAQLVGRMVRAPLARRIDANDHLNSVALYLPYYDAKTVKKVIDRLTSDADAVPPTKVREGKDAKSLVRAEGSANCFDVLERLPTYVVPRTRAMKPVARLAKLASLLAELGLMDAPIREYRSALVKVLLDERNRLADNPEFNDRVSEAAILVIRRARLHYASADASKLSQVEDAAMKAAIADENVDDLYAEAGRQLGEGLHKEYLRARLGYGSLDARSIKLELHALVASHSVLDKVDSAAETLRKSWTDSHKAALRKADEKHRQAFREIVGAGAEPELTTIDPPQSIEGSALGTSWLKHLYVDAQGRYMEDFASSWERKVVQVETTRSDVVGWLRNVDRKPWSLCVKRQQGSKWVGIYPDFIFFRETQGGILADIVDPHLLNDEHAPGRAAALARFAKEHGEHFGRIDLVIYGSDADANGKRLNLMDEKVRDQVAVVMTHEHLRHIFESS
jgi:type III restriction enzyme